MDVLHGGSAVVSGALGLGFAFAGHRAWRSLLAIAALLAASSSLYPLMQELVVQHAGVLPGWVPIVACGAVGLVAAACAVSCTGAALLAAAAAAGALVADSVLHALGVCRCHRPCLQLLHPHLMAAPVSVVVGAAAVGGMLLALLAQSRAPRRGDGKPLRRRREGGSRGGRAVRVGAPDEGDCCDACCDACCMGRCHGCCWVPEWLVARRGGSARLAEAAISAVLGAYGAVHCVEYWVGPQVFALFDADATDCHSHSAWLLGGFAVTAAVGLACQLCCLRRAWRRRGRRAAAAPLRVGDDGHGTDSGQISPPSPPSPPSAYGRGGRHHSDPWRGRASSVSNDGLHPEPRRARLLDGATTPPGPGLPPGVASSSSPFQSYPGAGVPSRRDTPLAARVRAKYFGGALRLGEWVRGRLSTNGEEGEEGGEGAYYVPHGQARRPWEQSPAGSVSGSSSNGRGLLFDRDASWEARGGGGGGGGGGVPSLPRTTHKSPRSSGHALAPDPTAALLAASRSKGASPPRAVSPRSLAADDATRERVAAERASARLVERQQNEKRSARKARARRVDFGDSDGEAD